MVLYLWAVAAIALVLSVSMAGAWVVQLMLRSRDERYRDYQWHLSEFFPLPPQTQKGVVT